MAAPSDNSINRLSSSSSLPTGEGVVIDIGTGDGLFVYRGARQSRRKFYIGIDANPRPLEKVSEKIRRKPSKGGLPNALFIQSSVEDLPPELDGVADELHVHFPWGSLFRAVAMGDQVVLRNLRRICSSEALLEVVIGVDPLRDRSEVERLGLPPLTMAYVDSVLAHLYRSAGFEIVERGELPASEWPTLETSWAKKLKGSISRSLVYLIARAAVVKQTE